MICIQGGPADPNDRALLSKTVRTIMRFYIFVFVTIAAVTVAKTGQAASTNCAVGYGWNGNNCQQCQGGQSSDGQGGRCTNCPAVSAGGTFLVYLSQCDVAACTPARVMSLTTELLLQSRRVMPAVLCGPVVAIWLEPMSVL